MTYLTNLFIKNANRFTKINLTREVHHNMFSYLSGNDTDLKGVI